MAEQTKVGVIGAGWPGAAHARGYLAAGGFRVVAVADLIPDRRKKFMAEFGAAKEYASAEDLIADRDVGAVSVCLPNHLHAPTVLAALKKGKHVVCENPPTLTAAEARKIESAATKAGRVVLYAFPRRFGGNEMAAKQTAEKAYAGEVYHVRAAWMRTRGVPAGTGWFTDRAQSGGGAMIDLGLDMLDLAWHLLGQPVPTSAYAVSHARFPELSGDVEDSAFALLRFEGGKSVELAASWAINQPPHQQGALCRAYGTAGAIEVYNPDGAAIYRQFNDKGDAKPTPLKQPKVTGYVAMMRHFKECVAGRAAPLVGPAEGATLMRMVDAIYKSCESGKSADVK